MDLSENSHGHVGEFAKAVPQGHRQKREDRQLREDRKKWWESSASYKGSCSCRKKAGWLEQLGNYSETRNSGKLD